MDTYQPLTLQSKILAKKKISPQVMCQWCLIVRSYLLVQIFSWVHLEIKVSVSHPAPASTPGKTTIKPFQGLPFFVSGSPLVQWTKGSVKNPDDYSILLKSWMENVWTVYCESYRDWLQNKRNVHNLYYIC